MCAIRTVIYTLLVSMTVQFVEPYRILGIFPYNGKSHDIMFNPLMMGLAKRGHQVDVITHFPPKNPPPNYKVVVDLNGTIPNIVGNFKVQDVEDITNGGNPAYITAKCCGNRLCELMALEAMQKLIKNPPANPPYDLVITEELGAHCFMGFGHLLKVPVVAISTCTEFPWISNFIGNNDNLAVVPVLFMDNFERTKFWDRLRNVFYYYWLVWTFDTETNKYQTEAMRKYLSPDMPNIRDIERSVALTLINTHPVINGPKPIGPFLVQVSGLHIPKTPPKLPAELKKWLDESTDGFVYFTFGSLILVESLPTNTLRDIYKSFVKLAPMRVLIKITNKNELPPGLPENVLTSPWIPQQAVLQHKNVRAFVTHGGLMGAQEALYYGVPMIGIPFIPEQIQNINNFINKNMALKINFHNLTSASLDEAFNEVLRNPKYRENARYYSKLFKDRPMGPMETAIFWIEHVIRNGPDTLRSPALDLYWWQLGLIDVYGFVLLIIVLVIVSLYYFIRSLLSKCFARSCKKTKTQKLH